MVRPYHTSPASYTDQKHAPKILVLCPLPQYTFPGAESDQKSLLSREEYLQKNTDLFIPLGPCNGQILWTR